MVVYLPSAENNVTHLHEVLGRLKRAGFTLNPDKWPLGLEKSSTWDTCLHRGGGLRSYLTEQQPSSITPAQKIWRT